jgi:hypothetical protein
LRAGVVSCRLLTLGGTRSFGLSMPEAPEVLDKMLRQRVSLGLTKPGPPINDGPPVVVPVLAVGAGEPAKRAKERMSQVAEAIASTPAKSGVAEFEAWRVDVDGHRTTSWA